MRLFVPSCRVRSFHLDLLAMVQPSTRLRVQPGQPLDPLGRGSWWASRTKHRETEGLGANAHGVFGAEETGAGHWVTASQDCGQIGHGYLPREAQGPGRPAPPAGRFLGAIRGSGPGTPAHCRWPGPPGAAGSRVAGPRTIASTILPRARPAPPSAVMANLTGDARGTVGRCPAGAPARVCALGLSVGDDGGGPAGEGGRRRGAREGSWLEEAAGDSRG
jgi:hypothetical protein